MPACHGHPGSPLGMDVAEVVSKGPESPSAVILLGLRFGSRAALADSSKGLLYGSSTGAEIRV